MVRHENNNVVCMPMQRGCGWRHMWERERVWNTDVECKMHIFGLTVSVQQQWCHSNGRPFLILAKNTRFLFEWRKRKTKKKKRGKAKNISWWMGTWWKRTRLGRQNERRTYQHYFAIALNISILFFVTHQRHTLHVHYFQCRLAIHMHEK